MKVSNYYYYIAYLVMGLIIAAPYLSWLESIFGKDGSSQWLLVSWLILSYCIGYYALWTAERRGVLLPNPEYARGRLYVFIRLLFAAGYAYCIFAVVRDGITGVHGSVIYVLVLAPALALWQVYRDYRASLRQKPSSG
jgi:hypothetical protein